MSPAHRSHPLLALAVALVLALAAPAGLVAAEEPTAPGDGRIIGGEPAPAGTWSSQAAILRADVRDPHQAQICGGTVISPTWVITAAHCVTSWDGDPVGAPEVHVLVGTHDLRSGGSRIPVRRVVVRHDYDEYLLANDVALLQLARPTGVARDMEIASRTDIPWSGARLTVAGWGQSDVLGDTYPARLRQVDVPAMSGEECRDALADFDGSEGLSYHSSHLCTGPIGTGGRGPCYGDSGGPLVWERGGRRILVGIVSWGYYCGSPETPSVFSKVASSSRWIAETISPGPHGSLEELSLYMAARYGPEPGQWALAPAEVVLTDLHASRIVTHRAGSIVRLYRAVLGRPTEQWGYAYWRDRMAYTGLSVARVAELMARAPEFTDRYGSLDDRDFVEQLYLNVLGRPGDGAGVDYWTARLATHTRGQVVAAIAEAPENRARTQAEVDVTVAFANLLGRTPRPDELSTWGPRPLGELATFLLHSYGYAQEVARSYWWW